MKIQIFQHLPGFPKAGIFRSLPILCVAFQTFIPERSAFRCFPLPCLSMFRPLVLMHKSAHPVTHSAAPPSHAPATLTATPAASQYPRIPAPSAPLPHRLPAASTRGSTPTPPPCSMPLFTAARSCHTRPPHPPLHSVIPCIPTPTAPLPAQATRRQHQGQRTHSRRCTATTPPHRTRTPHTPITPQSPAYQHPPPPLYSLLLL